MKTYWSLAVLVAITIPFSAIHAGEVHDFDHLWSGIYSVSQYQWIKAPNAPTGYYIASAGPILTLETTRIPARLGTRFGIKYVFRGNKGGTIDYRVVWRYPSQGLTDPATGKRVFSTTMRLTARIDEPLCSGHVFSYDWGLVPGNYVVEIWVGDRKIAGQFFEVYCPCGCPGLLTAPYSGLLGSS
jgi:hypothetical protein